MAFLQYYHRLDEKHSLTDSWDSHRWDPRPEPWNARSGIPFHGGEGAWGRLGFGRLGASRLDRRENKGQLFQQVEFVLAMLSSEEAMAMKPTKVALYARVSTRDQDSGMQHLDLHRMAEARGLYVVDESIDAGFSGGRIAGRNSTGSWLRHAEESSMVYWSSGSTGLYGV